MLPEKGSHRQLASNLKIYDLSHTQTATLGRNGEHEQDNRCGTTYNRKFSYLYWYIYLLAEGIIAFRINE